MKRIHSAVSNFLADSRAVAIRREILRITSPQWLSFWRESLRFWRAARRWSFAACLEASK